MADISFFITFANELRNLLLTLNFRAMTKQLQLQNDLLEFLDYGESIRMRPIEILMNVESPYNEWTDVAEYIPQMCICEEICRDTIDGVLFVRAGKYQTTLISDLSDNDIDKIYDNLNTSKQ